jgi:hypothetical protein
VIPLKRTIFIMPLVDKDAKIDVGEVFFEEWIMLTIVPDTTTPSSGT